MSTQTETNKVFRILQMAKPFWPHMFGLFVLALCTTPIALLKPFALKLLIDSGFGKEPMPGFIKYFFPPDFNFNFAAVVVIASSLVVIVALIENLYTIVLSVLQAYTGEKLVLNFRTILFNHIQRLSLGYHDKKGSSDALYRIQYDVTKIKTFLLSNLSPLITSLITLIAMIAVMFYIDWHFTLIAICIIPPLLFLTRLSRKKLRKNWRKVRDDESKAMSVVHEVLSSLRVVKAFGQEDSESERFASRASTAAKGQIQVAWFGAFYSSVVGMLLAVGTALFIYFGANYVQSGQMTLGELTLVISYLAQVFGPLHSISKNINDIQSSLVSIERVFDILNEEKEVKDYPDAIHIKKSNGAFNFDNVSFAYEKEKIILNNFSFSIQPGDRVGIKGATGAGKSTLISLIYRFYDPSSGSISMDGTDIRKIKLADYRNQFSIVLQEPVLFSTTIEENIRYGRPQASKAEIIEAAKAANAYDFIVKSKDGFDTMVGERGMQLSGGERQRISIARAFIKNSPILILDEPTSAIDVKTEQLIMNAMERLMVGKTTFMITHRLDTLRSCNVILNVENGNIKNTELLNEVKTGEEKAATLV